MKYNLTTLLSLYTAAMATGVTSPVPHAFGPPGSGKSSIAEEAAKMLGVNLHIINVSRVSPLELEGVQMPVEENSRLHLLTATFWTSLKAGDILLLDEFLRGFPEVYNGLLDILTSRRVGGFELPRVFIMAASNTTVAYDLALEDRLLHLQVPDIRRNQADAAAVINQIISRTGMYPEIADSFEMSTLISSEVLPMYAVLDKRNGAIQGTVIEGSSPRNLIGQTLLRAFNSTYLKTLLRHNNEAAARDGKWQYVIVGPDVPAPTGYAERAKQMLQGGKLTTLQRTNALLNLELIQVAEATQIKKGSSVNVNEEELFQD